MVAVGQFFGPRRVAIFAKPPLDPTFSSRLIAFLLAGAVIGDPTAMSFDIAKERRHVTRYEWTRNPVELAVTDNAITQPVEVTVRGILSPNPVGGLTTALGAFGSIIRRDREVVDKLRRIAAMKIPVALVTPERAYDSMGIESIEEVHGDRTKIDVIVRLRKILIVSPLLVTGAVDQDTLLAGVIQEANLGAQPTTAVPDPGGLG